MNIGDLVYDFDFGMHGLIVDITWVFEDDDGIKHDWEFLVLFSDGSLHGSDEHSMRLVS